MFFRQVQCVSGSVQRSYFVLRKFLLGFHNICRFSCYLTKFTGIHENESTQLTRGSNRSILLVEISKRRKNMWLYSLRNSTFHFQRFWRWSRLWCLLTVRPSRRRGFLRMFLQRLMWFEFIYITYKSQAAGLSANTLPLGTDLGVLFLFAVCVAVYLSGKHWRNNREVKKVVLLRLSV